MMLNESGFNFPRIDHTRPQYRASSVRPEIRGNRTCNTISVKNVHLTLWTHILSLLIHNGVARGRANVWSVPWRQTNSDTNRARAHYACSWCGWGSLDIYSSLPRNISFLSSPHTPPPPLSLSLSFSLSLFLGDGSIKTELLSRRAVKLKTIYHPSIHNNEK